MWKSDVSDNLPNPISVDKVIFHQMCSNQTHSCIFSHDFFTTYVKVSEFTKYVHRHITSRKYFKMAAKSGFSFFWTTLYYIVILYPYLDYMFILYPVSISSFSIKQTSLSHYTSFISSLRVMPACLNWRIDIIWYPSIMYVSSYCPLDLGKALVNRQGPLACPPAMFCIIALYVSSRYHKKPEDCSLLASILLFIVWNLKLISYRLETFVDC